MLNQILDQILVAAVGAADYVSANVLPYVLTRCFVCYAILALLGFYLLRFVVRAVLWRLGARSRRLLRDRTSTRPSEFNEADVPAINARLHAAFASGKTRPYEWRIEQLGHLRDMMAENRDAIIGAVCKDLGKKNPQEVLASDFNIVVSDIDELMHHLHEYMEPTKTYTNIAAMPASSWIYHDPVGAVLVMSPWNYPVNLAIVPLAGAIAAGNCVCVKLSPHAPATAAVLTQLLQRYLDPECFAIEGKLGRTIIGALLEVKWDHIMFTGSVSVGRIVAQAAAKHLTPCTLELGGKNPCIVDSTIDLRLAARRIAWGKWFNAGQTCLGVDYVLVEESAKARLIEELRRVCIEFYGENPEASVSFPRIISQAETQRLAGLMKCGRVLVGGQSNVEQKYIAPTIIDDVDMESKLMTDEIFGPLLPVVAVKSVRHAVEFLKSRPLPLALYLFTADSTQREYVLGNTRSGAALVNETLLHFTNGELPFGGVGNSGYGAYHGRRTFDTFTHQRAVIKSTTKSWLDLPLRYPPYGLWTWAIDFVTKTGY